MPPRPGGSGEECRDVDLGRVAVQDVVGQPFEGVVIDDRQDTERAVIQLVSGDIAREVGECPVKVIGGDSPLCLTPGPRPSSGSWRKERRRGDCADRLQLAVRYGKPSSMTKRTAVSTMRLVE